MGRLAIVARVGTFTRLTVSAMAVLGLGGCMTTAVEVTGEFPTPLVEPMPVAIGLYLPESFRAYTAEEQISDRGTYRVEIGEAQSALMQRLLPSMFERVVELDSPEAAAKDPSLDAVLVPEVADLQFAIPFQTKSKFYEVWVKYRFSLLTPDGSTITQWEMTGYGKTRGGGLAGEGASLQEAAIEALRDAGAFLAIDFRNQPGVRAWLGGVRATASSSPGDQGERSDDHAGARAGTGGDA